MLNTMDTVVYKIQSLLSESSLSGRGGGQESPLLPYIVVNVTVRVSMGVLQKHTQEKHLTQSRGAKEGFLEKSDSLSKK